MTPYYSDDWLTILQGDVREVLPTLASDSVDCIVTSPPFWGLRDYGHADQIGLERTPEEYVANMVGIFRELRRVLKASGTCWLNLGDSYAGSPSGTPQRDARNGVWQDSRGKQSARRGQYVHADTPGLKPKDLVGIPWRVAFALQADGWYLRSDIIWAKPNPMPESVTDRPTKAHEYLFLLTKSARYYFDADAVREDGAGRLDRGKAARGRFGEQGWRQEPLSDPAGRNLRSVWTIATRPYPGSHFAVFPPELPERCIKAGSSERGVCPECGAPWERVVVVERDGYSLRNPAKINEIAQTGPVRGGVENRRLGPAVTDSRETSGWRPTCDHGTDWCSDDACPLLTQGYLAHPKSSHTNSDVRDLIHTDPAVILDPFAGSGTTGMVANRLSRRAILIDLNGDYLKQQLQRNAQTPLGLGAA